MGCTNIGDDVIAGYRGIVLQDMMGKLLEQVPEMRGNERGAGENITESVMSMLWGGRLCRNWFSV
jgi:hypothetical protein